MLQLWQHHSLLSVRSLCLHGPQKKCWVDGSAKEQAATEPPKAPPRSSAASLAASSGPNSNEATGPSTAVDSGPGSAGTADGRYAVALRQFLLLCPRCTAPCAANARLTGVAGSAASWVGSVYALYYIAQVLPWTLLGSPVGPGFAVAVEHQLLHCWLSSVFDGHQLPCICSWLGSTWGVACLLCSTCLS